MQAESASDATARMRSPWSRSSERSTSSKLFELRDLYRIPIWAAAKPAYVFAPISFHLRLATTRGSFDSLRPRRRNPIRESLGRHLGDVRAANELDDIARRHLQFRRRSEVARVWPQLRDFAGFESIEIKGLQHLDEALARGKGAILVSAHFGYTRLIKPILRAHGREVLLIGPAPGRSGPENYPPFTTRLGNAVRHRLLSLPRASSADERWSRTVGVDLPIGMNMRPYLGALARNAAVIILADGRGAQSLRPKPVLGIEVPFAPGALNLARSSGAPALPAFVVDEPEHESALGFRLVIHPPLEVQVSDDAGADLDVNLSRFASVLERQAFANPHNWQWGWVSDRTLHNPRPVRART